ncbi:cytochrome b/b6 domain-containing protein [Mesorhizobium sp. J428]|uniref:cytochrome b/b6 domain-containing protein n=1 Tax=Mesorhizobium sp. J428 TaxID=2898440 RepID=UPI0021507022|nr:cytochrome b/b6 domain-containing protein [Mesorhizobium sp. J428]MCR5856532.1 cytochrome b/b6 domain-containing protein [Mesorhizobium sp. J428]
MSAEPVRPDAGGAMPPATVKVWDPFVRVFHWSLVALFVFAFLTGDEWQGPHEIAGYVIAGLVAARVIWGLVGSRNARFASFVRSPAEVIRFLGKTARFSAPRHLGHNPAGGAMILVLLVAIGAIATTGYMMTTDAYWGVRWVKEAHEAVVYSTLGLVALHVAGVVLASVEHRENLVRAMFTGRKRAPGPDDLA